jgi:hypothetical protein
MELTGSSSCRRFIGRHYYLEREVLNVIARGIESVPWLLKKLRADKKTWVPMPMVTIE